MDKTNYNSIWMKLLSVKQRKTEYVDAGRQDKCILEILKSLVNSLYWQISISNCIGEVFLALYNDKIWVNSSSSAELDRMLKLRKN